MFQQLSLRLPGGFCPARSIQEPSPCPCSAPYSRWRQIRRECLHALPMKRRRVSSVGSVGAVVGARGLHGRICNVRAVAARLSATRATEQRVALRTLAVPAP